MKFVMVNGASCSGKSTIVKKLLSEKARYYKVSYDALKWGFSQYKPDEHFEDVRALVRALVGAVCDLKYNIICDSGLYKDSREKMFEIAIQHGYEIIEVNLDADYSVLAERFEQRLIDSVARPEIKMSNKSKERHRELFDIYEAEKNTKAVSFRTDKLNVDEISTDILNLM
jgi:predicted kinase